MIIDLLELVGDCLETFAVLRHALPVKTNERDDDERQQKDGQDDVRCPERNRFFVVGEPPSLELGRRVTVRL